MDAATAHSQDRRACLKSAQEPTLRVARRWGYSGKTMIAIALATRAGADRG
jgi:hypothetical protein